MGARTRLLVYIGRVAYRRLRARLRHTQQALFTAAQGRFQWAIPVTTWQMRHGHIPAALRGHIYRVCRGRRFRRLRVHRWHFGFSWGSLARTRTTAVFKRRASAKKRRGPVPTSRVFEEARIQRIRETKTGLRRRGTARYEEAVEAQLRAAM